MAAAMKHHAHTNDDLIAFLVAVIIVAVPLAAFLFLVLPG